MSEMIVVWIVVLQLDKHTSFDPNENEVRTSLLFEEIHENDNNYSPSESITRIHSSA